MLYGHIFLQVLEIKAYSQVYDCNNHRAGYVILTLGLNNNLGRNYNQVISFGEIEGQSGVIC